jgi:3-dehydroquinate dehydratase-2
MKVLVIHGPLLDTLGTREPEIYGYQTRDDIDNAIRKEAAELGFEVEIHQTAREGEFVELLTAGVGELVGAVLNPAAYSHTSRAIAEAIAAVPYPVIEVHLSNIHAREPWRRRSVTAGQSVGVIAGFRGNSYLLALRALKEMIDAPTEGAT